MEVVVTTGLLELCRAKLQSNHHHQQTNIQFFTGWMPFLSPNQRKALKGKYIPWTRLPQAHLGVFQLCLWPLIAPGYLGGRLPCLSSAHWCQYPKFLLGISLINLLASHLFDSHKFLIRILSTFVIILNRKRRQQTMTYLWRHYSDAVKIISKQMTAFC